MVDRAFHPTPKPRLVLLKETVLSFLRFLFSVIVFFMESSVAVGQFVSLDTSASFSPRSQRIREVSWRKFWGGVGQGLGGGDRDFRVNHIKYMVFSSAPDGVVSDPEDDQRVGSLATLSLQFSARRTQGGGWACGWHDVQRHCGCSTAEFT